MDPTPPPASPTGAADTRGQHMPDPDRRSGGHRRNLAYVAGCVLAAAAVGAVSVALLTGGDGDPVASPTTPPAPVTSSPAPAPTVPAAPTPEDVAAEQAQARYLEYRVVTDRVANGGYTDLKAYASVAIDPHTGVLLQGAVQQAGKIITTGAAKVISLTVQSVELDRPDGYPSVRLLACLDVRPVTAVNAAGQSVVSPDRPDRLKSEVLVQDVPPGAFTDGREPGWYVADVEQRGEPC